MKFIRLLFAFASAVGVTALLGSIAATQFIVAELQKMQIDVPLGVRLNTTLHDIVGMTPLYSAIVAGALLVAFSVALVLTRFTPPSRTTWLMIGGFVGVIAVLLLLRWVLGGTPVAGARGPLGLAVQGFAGLAGGWVFGKVSRVEDSQQ